MKKTGFKVLREDKWQIEKDLVLKKRKAYIPKNKELRVEIIQLYYNILVVEYKKRQKITKLVTRNDWWPEVIKDIRKYIDSCDMCQRIKNRIEIPAEKLKLSEVLERSQTYLTVDFITQLPLVVGKNVILVVCNRLSKILYFVVAIEGTSAEELARLFRDNI